MSPKINVLIVGTGMYVSGRGTDGAGTILPAVIQTYKSGLVGELFVATRNPQSFEAFSARFNNLCKKMGVVYSFKRYPSNGTINPESYREAMRELPDPAAVIVAVPDHLHYEIARTAIQAGKHVLVVKPLVPTVAQAHELIEIAEQGGVYAAVDFHKRWDEANLRIRDLIHDGSIGEPLYFHVDYSQRKMIPTKFFTEWVHQTDIFQYLGVHYADLIHFLTGDFPFRVLATGQQIWLPSQGVANYDSMQVLVEWSKGFVSTISTNWIDPNSSSAMSLQRIKVTGTLGSIESDQTNRGIRLVTDAKGVEEINPYFCQWYREPADGMIAYRGYGVESVTQFLRDLELIVQRGITPKDLQGKRPTFRDALVSTALIEGVHQSLEHNSSWVHFKDRLIPSL